MGDGTTTNRWDPVPVTALGTEVAGVALGAGFACARKTGGSLWCWGGNANGRLGYGAKTSGGGVHVKFVDPGPVFIV